MKTKKGERFYIGAITEYYGSFDITNLFLYVVRESKVLKVEHEIAQQWREGEWSKINDEFVFGNGYHHTPVDGREVMEEDFKVLEKYVTTVYKGGKHV